MAWENGRISIGDEVGAYEIVRLIAAGTQAEVYEVRHAGDGTRHAFKLLLVNLPTGRERFERENSAQSRLRHPNIIEVHGLIGIGEDELGILMEYADGPTLSEWMANRTHIDLNEALLVFRGILAGARHAHSKNLIHRDIKPGNIILTKKDDRWVPKLGDFGLVRDSEEVRRSTKTGTTLGSPQYMSPEQIADSKYVDFRSDLFSLGGILYKLVTGVAPFQGASGFAVMTAVSEGNYRPPRSVAPNLPPHIAEVIEGLLTLEVDDRLADYDDIERRLFAGLDSPSPAKVAAAIVAVVAALAAAAWAVAL